MKNKYCFVAVLLFVTAVCAGIFTGLYNRTQKDRTEDKVLAVTSFYPVYIVTANIVGDCEGIEVRNLSEPQTGCLHDFQLTPEDMKLLSSADVFLANGGGMESFLGDVEEQYPDLQVIETTDELRLPDENAHVWMSIRRCRSQAAYITKQLCEISPENAQELESNAKEYDRKLAELEAQQKEIMEKAKGTKILSFHEAYEYIADDYGLVTGYTINLDEERQISAGEVADVLEAVKKDDIHILFAEEFYGSGLADTVQKETDVKVYYLDTLVRGDYSLDSYIDGMQKNIDILKDAFGV